MTDQCSGWNEEELVPLGDLRPSREHFGPVPADKANRPAQRQARPVRKAQGQPTQARQNGQPVRQPRPQTAPEAVVDLRTPVQRPVPAQVGAPAQAAAPAQARVARPATAAPAQARTQAPVRQGGQPARTGQPPVRRPAAAPAPRQTPQRHDEFANGLAARDKVKAPVALKPSSGWRGALLKASGGTLNVGVSAAQKLEAKYRHQLRRPVTDGTVAVFSRKGGVGKTTISAYLGLTLAAERGGRIVALDGDAEAGSLGWLLAPEARSTLAALSSADPIPNDYAGLRRYTASTPEGLEVIVGDPAEMGPISTTGLEAVADQLARHYDVSIFDTGAGVTRATGRVLVNSARVLLLVMGPSVDSVRAAERTLAWIEESGNDAVDPDVQVIAVINGIPTNAKEAHIQRIESHFSDRCSAVVRIPWDAHLANGSTSVSLDRLAKPTRQAFLELAATTVGTIARPLRRPVAVGARRAS